MSKLKLLGLAIALILPVSANAQELITNGSFESDIDGWECGYDSYCTIFTDEDGLGDASNGSSWLYLTPGYYNDFEYETIEQTINIPAGTKSLALSLDYQFYLEGGEDLNSGHFAVALDLPDGSTDYSFWSTDDDEASSWKHFSKYINNDSLSGQSITIRLSVSEDWPWTTSADIDAVSVVASDHYQVDVPAHLKAKTKNSNIPLEWDDVIDANYYQVQLRKNNGNIIKKWKNVESDSVNASKYLKKTAIYKFRVRACYGDDCSAWTDYKTFSVILWNIMSLLTIP